jgi:hypothetical protein
LDLIREKIDASREREIILYSIVSTEYLSQIRKYAKAELFKSPYAKVVWGWIASYFDEYNAAPNKDIQTIYTTRKLEIPEEEDEEILATFLQSLSDSDVTIQNIGYSADQAITWLNVRAQENLIDDLKEAVSRKDVASGNEIIAQYAAIEKHQAKGVDILTDVNRAMAAFGEEEESLFSFPGAVGCTMGEFRRTDFVAFQAYIKTGKTRWLWESAREAVFASNKVLFISLEMPEKHMLKWAWRSFAKKPKRTQTVRIPYFVESDLSTEESKKYTIDYEEKEVQGFTADALWFEQWLKKFKMYFRGGDVRLCSMPSRSVTVSDIEIYMNNLEFYDKWIPDVVVIDYADLIASKLRGEYRHQLDDIWANLRRLALQRNICVITASQSGRSASKGESTDANIAEDIRKAAHVTKLLAINATAEEKAKGIFRIAQLAERDDARHFEQSLVLSCLDLGQVCLDSRFLSHVEQK